MPHQAAGGSSPQQRAGYPGDADHARTSVGADHWPDLGDEDRLGAEDLAPALDQALGLLVGLDVLDDPAIGSVVVELVHVLDHTFECASRGAHALDGRDFILQRQDRHDLQRAAEPGLGFADAPAAAHVLERIQAEPDLCLLYTSEAA